MNCPLLSFCIPTYNRASFLEATLKSYITCASFDTRVEIVISDNHSSDATQKVGESYANKFTNIKYFRNEENLNDANFPLSLERATGKYVKLMNDNIHINEEGLKGMLDFLSENAKKRIPVFFCSHYYNHNRADLITCQSADDFATIVSRSCTGINMFGAWKEDWEIVKEPLRYSYLKLSQVDWCYQILKYRNKAVLYTKPFSSKKKDVGMRRGGYNWFEVQIQNYYTILKPYIDNGLISKQAIKKEKITCLLNILPWIATRYWLPMYKEYQFDWNNSTKYLWNAFKTVPLFYLIMVTIPIWANYYFFKYIIRQILLKFGINLR